MDTKIPQTFWTDPDFENCQPDVLLAVIWLKTNDRLNLLGFSEVSPRHFEFQSRMPFATFGRACEALGKGLVRDGNRYWLRDFIREQIGSGAALMRNHMRKPLVRALSLIDSPSIHSEILLEYPELMESESLSHDEGAPKPQEKRGEEKRGEEQSKDALTEFRPRAGRSGASKPADHPEPMHSRMVAIGEIMRRRSDSVWNEAEKKSLLASGLVGLAEPDFTEQVHLMRALYRATIPETKEFQFRRRTTLPTLLNNWPSELDKARSWRLAAGGSGDGVTKIA